MKRTFVVVAGIAGIALSALVAVQAQDKFVPVTQKMLENPSPDDWLMYSRTYDAQRFSPLKQITKANVGQIKEAFKKELGNGPHESIPIAYRGVLYVQFPGATIQAINGATGETIWEYKYATGGSSRAKTLSIFDDMVYYTAPDNSVVALDAMTGAERWKVKTPGNPTSGTIVVEGKVLSGRACGNNGTACYVLALDAKTGKELWKFYTVAQDSDPEAAKTWGGVPQEKREASQWGLPGGYDPQRKLVFWGISNPMPNTRLARHNGNPDAVAYDTPSDLYSNSTVTLNPDSGKLVWYYQHLPGDDWDEDYPHERTLIRTAVSPDPKFVKWINPDIRKGQQRDISLSVGEGGGIWALDRQTGQFLWASPFPFEHPEFPDLEHRTQDRSGVDQQEPDVHGLRSAPCDLLLEHPQLLAYGLQPAAQRALRSVSRELSRHDVGGAGQRARQARRHHRARGESRYLAGTDEGQRVDRRSDADLQGTRAVQRGGARDRRRSDLLG